MKNKTFVVTVRIDIRDAATIYEMLKYNQVLPDNPSQIASFGLELLAELAKAKEFETFETTGDALTYLQNEGIMSDLTKNRNYKNLLKALSAEDKVVEQVQRTPVESRSDASSVEDLAAAVRRRMEEQEKANAVLHHFPKGGKDEQQTDENA